MAEQKESKVKKRQLTLTFDVTRPSQERLWEDLKEKAKRWRKPRQELAVVAIFHGLEAAEARVKADYEAALKRDDALFAPAAETPPAPPVDPGKWLDKTRHAGACRDCKNDIPVGSRARYYEDKSMVCQSCYEKVAA